MPLFINCLSNIRSYFCNYLLALNRFHKKNHVRNYNVLTWKSYLDYLFLSLYNKCAQQTVTTTSLKLDFILFWCNNKWTQPPQTRAHRNASIIQSTWSFGVMYLVCDSTYSDLTFLCLLISTFFLPSHTYYLNIWYMNKYLIGKELDESPHANLET